MDRERKSAEPTSEREVTITRLFDVPARILFLAWSKPEHVREWFGPKGFPLTRCEIDFRVGGKYRFAMTGPNGKEMTPFGGEYLVMEQDRKISYTSRLEQPGAETMIVTITFAERDGKTMLTQHTLFASVAMKKKHLGMGYETGVGSGLEQLGVLASRLASA